ncbi:hypothetical protein FQN54_005528 [Arachnomyces sp. PD_36]|nr:hypothetical protein FQN54_005528 [Arachnomyces sp. PD_36]
MSSQPPQALHSVSIYHGLPTFPPNIKGLSAIVAGANGISGDHMMRVLSESPQRWTNIYALSRRPPVVDRKWETDVKHVSMDFLNSSPEELARQLKEGGVKADYVFFFSYIQAPPKKGGGLWSDADAMVEKNVPLLSNLLQALKLSSITPKRIMLQTGAKHYGVHLGPTLAPQEESDPRINLEQNFYYNQEDVLFKYCQETGSDWNVVMPATILGAVKDAAMNAVFPIGVFAAVNAHLGKPMVFPGDITSYEMIQTASSAKMNAYIEEWAVLSGSGTANQRFNACDDSAFSWSRLWPALAKLYGVQHKGPDPNAKYTTNELAYEPPRGFGPKGKINATYTLTQWAKQPEVQETWAKISKQHNLVQSPFENESDIDRLFGFADGFLLTSWPTMLSMDKCQKLGFHGYVNTFDSFRAVLEDFTELKMLPPLPK